MTRRVWVPRTTLWVGDRGPGNLRDLLGEQKSGLIFCKLGLKVRTEMPDVGQPLKPHEVKALIRAILEDGGVRWGDHALKELAKDDLEVLDATNVLRAGVVREPQWENGEWRYRVETPRICVVVAFRSETVLRVVTAWRKKA